MEEWKEYKLGDLYDVHNGLSKGGKFFGSGYPFLSFKTVFNNYFLPPVLPDLVQSDEKEQNGYNIKRGDVFVTRTSETSEELGMSSVALKDYPFATYNGFTKRLRPKDPSLVFPEFIGYYLRSTKFRNLFYGLASSMSTRASLANGDLLGIKVFLPSYETQERIAWILKSLDDKIELNRRINENLEQQAQALFKSWFVDFEPFKGGKFVNSEFGKIPEGWKVGTIGDYSKIRSGFAFKSSWWTDKGVKIVKIKNISSSGNLDMSDCSYVSKENTLKAKEFSLKPGDLLIAMTGATIGKFCIVPILKEEMYVNQRVGKFFLGEKPILKAPFIYGLLKSENIISQIINKGQGSAQPNISANDIEITSIILPPEDIISKYNELVSPYFSLLIKNLNECDYLAQLRDILLPKLMSGELQI